MRPSEGEDVKFLWGYELADDQNMLHAQIDVELVFPPTMDPLGGTRIGWTLTTLEQSIFGDDYKQMVVCGTYRGSQESTQN